MSKATKVIFGLGIGVAAGLVVRSLVNLGSAAKAIQLKVLSINIKGINGLALTLQIFNPTKTAIKIDSISGEIYFNNKQIGVIQYFNTVPIAPLAYSTFKDINVELTPLGVITLVSQIIKRTKSGGTFLVSGYTYINNIGVPFSQQFKAW